MHRKRNVSLKEWKIKKTSRTEKSTTQRFDDTNEKKCARGVQKRWKIFLLLSLRGKKEKDDEIFHFISHHQLRHTRRRAYHPPTFWLWWCSTILTDSQTHVPLPLALGCFHYRSRNTPLSSPSKSPPFWFDFRGRLRVTVGPRKFNYSLHHYYSQGRGKGNSPNPARVSNLKRK